MKRLLPILTLLFVFILTPFASATTPLGLTQSEVDRLSGYGQEEYMDKTKFAIDYRQFAGGSLESKNKPTAHFQLKLQNSEGDVLQTVQSPIGEVLQVQTPKLNYSTYSRDTVKNKIIIEDLSSPYTGRTINMYDIQHRFVPEGKNRADYPIHSYDPTKVTSWSRVQQIIDDAINSVNENGTLEIYLAVSDKGEPYNNLPNWSANGNVAVLDTTKPNLYPKGMIWYFTGMEIEFTDDWYVKVITTEPAPKETPESWETDTHLLLGKIATPQGLQNITDIGKNIPHYYQEGEKATLDFTFWNPSDTVIAHPLPYALIQMEYNENWFSALSFNNYLEKKQTDKDILANRQNIGNLNFEYTVNPDLITKGETINRISRDESLFPFPVEKNPVNDNDEFITLAIVADPDAVINHLTGIEDSAYDDATTNIMVVHIPVEKGLDIGVKLVPRQTYWQIPMDTGSVYPVIDVISTVNINNHYMPIVANGYKEVAGIKREEFEMVKVSGQPPFNESIGFTATKPGKYVIRAGIPTEDENGNPILFKVDDTLQLDVNPANNHDEVVIEVGIGPPLQDKTMPDIDTGYVSGDHIRGDLTG